MKSTACTTLVQPVLENSSTVWDLQLATDIQSLEQIQRRATRFVHRNYTGRFMSKIVFCRGTGNFLLASTYHHHAVDIDHWANNTRNKGRSGQHAFSKTKGNQTQISRCRLMALDSCNYQLQSERKKDREDDPGPTER